MWSDWVSAEDVTDLHLFIVDAMGKWKNEMPIVPPKAHGNEDHLCLQKLLFNGIGDLGKDFLCFY